MAQDPMPDRSVPPLIVSHEQPSPYFAEPKRQPTGLSTPIEKPRSADLSEYREQAEFIPTTAGQHRSLLDVLKHWTLELISWVGCIIVIVATVVLLAHYDGKPPPEGFVTLNALLQLFITAAQFLFTIPLLQALGQLKWLWFYSKPRSLSSFAAYEDASRGSWGSAGLLFNLWKAGFMEGFLPRLAAVVMVSSALTGPITQQVLNTTLVLLPARNGTMAMASRATTLSRGKTPNGSVNLNTNDLPEIRRAVLEGGYFSMEEPFPYSPPACSTADCRWEAYETIGICSEVVNSTGRYTQPNFDNIANVTARAFTVTYQTLAGVTNVTTTQPRYHANMYPVVPDPSKLNDATVDDDTIISQLALFFMEDLLTAGQFTNFTTLMPTFQSLDITFYWCVKSMQSHVVGGKAETEELSSRAKMVKSPGSTLNMVWNNDNFDNRTAFGFQCPEYLRNETAVLEGESGKTFTLDGCTALLMSNYFLLNTYEELVVQEPDKTFIGVSGDLAYPLSVALFGLYAQEYVPDLEQKVRNVENLSRNIARRLTNFVTDNGASYVNSEGGVPGVTLDTYSVVDVKWEWMALLALQSILTAVVLAATIFRTQMSSIENMKNSSLATMCFLDDDTRAKLIAGDGRTGGMAKQATETRVKLNENVMRIFR